MNSHSVMEWLLEADAAIQYQVYRDLLGRNKKQLQQSIATQGWGHILLSKRKPNGQWGDRFYQPKWTSTHYTLLDLRNLNLSQDNGLAQETIGIVLKENQANDGGLRLGPSTSQHSDVCVNAMFLNYASYFRTPEKDLRSIVDSILCEIMADGGFNCRTTRTGAKHSSLHTTLSVLEGLTEFQKAGHRHQYRKIRQALESGTEFILQHRLFLSDRTGRIIHKDFLKLTYPCRWKYDILRALDYFQYAKRPWDNRMRNALEVLHNKRNQDGTWNMQSAHPGHVHMVMEVAGKASRWNTLRALRVLKHFGGETGMR
ncbi:MAG: hypothetical protein JNN04_00580 [Cyclobacteriaceae bacterium]|nr:hypothetical protein [Cyclobacteriaceae bacterium]